MQRIAGELNLSETAFISSPATSAEGRAAEAAYGLRWFTPTTGAADGSGEQVQLTALACGTGKLMPASPQITARRGPALRPCDACKRCGAVPRCGGPVLEWAALWRKAAAEGCNGSGAAYAHHTLGLHRCGTLLPSAERSQVPEAFQPPGSGPIHFETLSGRLTVAQLPRQQHEQQQGAPPLLQMSLPLAEPSPGLPPPFAPSPFHASTLASQPSAAQALVAAAVGGLEVCDHACAARAGSCAGILAATCGHGLCRWPVLNLWTPASQDLSWHPQRAF